MNEENGQILKSSLPSNDSKKKKKKQKQKKKQNFIELYTLLSHNNKNFIEEYTLITRS